MRVRGPSITGGTSGTSARVSWSEESWSLTTLRPDPGPSAEGYLVSNGFDSRRSSRFTTQHDVRGRVGRRGSIIESTIALCFERPEPDTSSARLTDASFGTGDPSGERPAVSVTAGAAQRARRKPADALASCALTAHRLDPGSRPGAHQPDGAERQTEPAVPPPYRGTAIHPGSPINSHSTTRRARCWTSPSTTRLA